MATTVYIGSASIDENGNASGGKAGNQSGKEIRKQAWYKHKKGWRVFRAKAIDDAKLIADDMRFAIANRHIGYDQSQRNSLYTAASKVGFDCAAVETDCETDCSALVRVCCAYAGITLSSSFRTVNEPSMLLATGKFTEMKGTKYTDQSAYLREGDILCTKTSGHTVVVLNDGDKAEETPPEDDSGTSGGSSGEGGKTVSVALSVLKKGCKGQEVKSLQILLIAAGNSCGNAGADGDFGSGTYKSVCDFQTANNLVVDGIVGAKTWSKLIKG